MPQLSVILPCYNAESYLRETLESILNQTFEDFELLLRDDASQDRSLEIAKSFKDPRLKILGHGLNQGKTGVVNEALKDSSGTFVTIHDADDVSLPERFERQVSLLQKEESLCAVGCSFVEVDLAGQPKNTVKASPSIGPESKETYHGPTLIIRREYLESFGCIYRPFFLNYKEDIDLFYRLKETAPLGAVLEPLYHYRIVPGSLSKALTPRKMALRQLVDEFALQRRSRPCCQDDLMRGDLRAARWNLRKLMKPYLDDESLIWRENAAWSLYYGLDSSVEYALRAVRKNPLDHRNLRTLFYVLRKRQ